MKPHSFPLSYEDALLSDYNIIQEKQYIEATTAQGQQLVADRLTIAALVRHHLGLADDDSVIIKGQECRIGNFNICIPVIVKSFDVPCRNLFLRCAMPHKLGEMRSPGSVDEKMNCEVATYAWMQEHCPDIRIPHLYGFGFTDHRQFTHRLHRTLFTRVLQCIRHTIHRWFGSPALLSHYVFHPSHYRLPAAYMLLEDVSGNNSQILSNTWAEFSKDPVRRRNLYRGLTRTILSLSRVPQPRIGAFRFQHDGTITLSNRPLTTTIAILENDGAPRCIPQDRTYAAVESYVSDMLAFHDGRFDTHCNATYNDDDCRNLMASKAAFRAIAYRYILEDRREGPFHLQFDDLHASNIFVDDEWNVTSLVDLEWVNAQPAEMMRVPYWLTDGDLAGFEGEQLECFVERRKEFMEVFEEEERKVSLMQNPVLTHIMEQTWESGGAWFWTGLASTNTMRDMWDNHICSMYGIGMSHEKTLSQLWCPDSEGFVRRKLQQHDKYCMDLKRLYPDS